MTKQFAISLLIGCSLWAGQCLAAEPIARRDPTKPAIDTSVVPTEKRVEQTFKLQAIIISRSRRLALIDDVQVSIGDKIGDATVEMISENSVTLSRAGENVTLYLINMQGWKEKK